MQERDEATPEDIDAKGLGVGPDRVAIEAMEIIGDMLPEIHRKGEYFRAKLEGLAKKHSFIKEVRVHGLMIGIELDRPGKELVIEAMKEGLLINCTHDVVIRFLPPFIISDREIDRAVRILGRIFKRFGQ